MATLKLKLENGFFVGSNNCNVKVLEPTHVIANDWECYIYPDGAIRCISTDGENSMHYVIQPNGFAKLTIKPADCKVETLKKGFVVPHGTKVTDGILGLAGGHIFYRYGFFRADSFQNFMDKYGITAVKHEDPNGEYFLHNVSYDNGGECHSSLYSDGTILKKGSNEERTVGFVKKSLDSSEISNSEFFKVTNATWAIHDQVRHEFDKHTSSRILYTVENDVTKLVGLPNLSNKNDTIMQLEKVGKKGYLSEKELENALRKILPDLPKRCHQYKSFWIESVESDLNYCLATNSDAQIKFRSYTDMERALSELRGVIFATMASLEEALIRHGFQDFQITKYYAFISTNDQKSEIYVEKCASTNNGIDFYQSRPYYWTAKFN